VTEIYRGADAATAIMSAQNALKNVNGSNTDDFSTFSDQQGGIHFIGHGEYIISTPLVQRSGCPMIGTGGAGHKSNNATTLRADGNISEVIDIKPDAGTDPYGWGVSGYEDTFVQNMRIRGQNTDDTCNLIISTDGGQDHVLRNLELEATKGYAFDIAGTQGNVIEDVRVDVCGDANQTAFAGRLGGAGYIKNLRYKNTLSNPVADLFRINGEVTAENVQITGGAGPTNSLVQLNDNATLVGFSANGNSGNGADAIQATGSSTVVGGKVDHAGVGVGLRTRSSGAVYHIDVSNTNQHGIVIEDETLVDQPDVSNPSQSSSGTYDAINITSRAGGTVRYPRIDGGGSARDGVRFTAKRGVLIGIDRAQNLNGSMVNDAEANNADNDIRGLPFTTDGSVIDIASTGDRTRFNGVIGGGPLAGVDLSSTTGQFDGDLAVADGTSAASAGAWARWDGAAWHYVDPTGTV
jgi:hypothetical protein